MRVTTKWKNGLIFHLCDDSAMQSHIFCLFLHYIGFNSWCEDIFVRVSEKTLTMYINMPDTKNPGEDVCFLSRGENCIADWWSKRNRKWT